MYKSCNSINAVVDSQCLLGVGIGPACQAEDVQPRSIGSCYLLFIVIYPVTLITSVIIIVMDNANPRPKRTGLINRMTRGSVYLTIHCENQPNSNENKARWHQWWPSEPPKQSPNLQSIDSTRPIPPPYLQSITRWAPFDSLYNNAWGSYHE